MIKIRRLGHATLSTADIESQIDYYTRVLGLSLIERTVDRAFLATKQGLEAIELVNGEPGRLTRLSFQIAPDSDCAAVARELEQAGLKCQIRHGISPGIDRAVSFTDPKGTEVDLFAEYRFSKNDPQPAMFNIVKLGHVAYRVRDVQEVARFYGDLFGFRISDWRGDHFVFMRCNTDHHTLNFVVDERPALHHIAFEVLDWSEIHKAVDYLAKNGIHLVWGPGRHIIGHNIATYHRNADKVRVELFCEMDQMKDEALGYFDPRPWHQEFPLRPKRHGPETLRNYWGYGSERVIPGYQTDEVPTYSRKQ
ncbi:MAG TPA: VOC family protein [Hyphomicrobiaceae bacterium]|nr:VOC family protein [Hyphomicrobiaceae bacterium]